MNKNKLQSGRSTRLVIIIIAAVVALAVAGFVIWQIFLRPKDTGNKTITAEPIAAKTVEGAYNLINNKYKSSTVTITKYLDVKYSPAYKPSGSIYYITMDKSAILGILDISKGALPSSDFSKSVVADISKYLTDNKFTKDASITGTTVDYYSAPTAICSLDRANAMPITLDCADISDYTASVSAIDPFVKLFTANRALISATDSVFGMPKIKILAPGYQTAIMTVGSYTGIESTIALFYKKDGGDWAYFESTQPMIPCGDFNTAELKAAYKGMKCYDNSIEGIVK